MWRVTPTFRRLRHYAVGIALLFGGMGLLLLFMGWFFFVRGACITNGLSKISNLSGYDFEINETNCDTLGNVDTVSVLVSKTGQAAQTPVFKFGPARDPVPTIKMLGPHTVQMSIAWVADVYSKQDKWEDLSIEYDIGQIDFPTSGDKVKE